MPDSTTAVCRHPLRTQTWRELSVGTPLAPNGSRRRNHLIRPHESCGLGRVPTGQQTPVAPGALWDVEA